MPLVNKDAPPPMTLSQHKRDQWFKTYLLDWAVAERVQHVFGTGCCYRVSLHLFWKTYRGIQTTRCRLRNRLAIQHKTLIHRSIIIRGVSPHLRSWPRPKIAGVLPLGDGLRGWMSSHSSAFWTLIDSAAVSYAQITCFRLKTTRWDASIHLLNWCNALLADL